MKRLPNIENKLAPVVLIVILISFWELATRGGAIREFILPPPSNILVTFVKTMPKMLDHIVITLYEALTGFFLAIFLALFIAVLMDSVEVIKKALYPILIVSQTVPIITIAPLFTLWFGFGYLPKIIVVILVCFFPIVVSLIVGLNSADKELINLVKSMGATKLQIYKIVKLPAALPHFFSGLKIAATYSVMGAVIGEWLGGKKGLGVYMERVRYSFAIDKVFATILIIIILSMVIFKAINILEKTMMPWQQEQGEDY